MLGDLRGNGLNMTLCAAGPSTTGRLAGGNFAGRGEYYVVLCFFVAFAVGGKSQNGGRHLVSAPVHSQVAEE